MDTQPFGDLEVDSAWVYNFFRSPKKIKIGFKHQWVIHQLSMLWLTHSLEVHLNRRSSPSQCFSVG